MGVGADLTIELGEDGADPERIDELTRMLRRELDGLDVERVEPLSAGQAPERTRGLDMAVVGGLLMTLGQSAHALAPVIAAIRSWVVSQPRACPDRPRRTRRRRPGALARVRRRGAASGGLVRQPALRGTPAGMTGRRRALVVAIDEYDNPGLRVLRSPSADAEALATVLAIRGSADFTVDVVRNEPAHEVQARIEDLFARGPGRRRVARPLLRPRPQGRGRRLVLRGAEHAAGQAGVDGRTRRFSSSAASAPRRRAAWCFSSTAATAARSGRASRSARAAT